MTNLIQSLGEIDQTPEDIDYVQWAKLKFSNEAGELDIAALAKGKYESDIKFIPKLTSELQEVRREATTKASLEDFMQQYEARRAQTNTQGNPPQERQADNQSSTQGLTEEQIRKISSDEWVKRNQEAQANANINKVKTTLADKWGSGAKEKLEARAKALNVGLDFLEQVAVRAPEAFLELVLDKAPTSPPINPNSSNPPRTNTNSQSVLNTNGNHKSRKQWNDIRRKSGSNSFWTPENMRMMLTDQEALGDAFDR